MVAQPPASVSLEQARKLAKDLKRALIAEDPAALSRVATADPDFDRRSARAAKLADAQRVVARELGFRSWPRLRKRLDELTGLRADAEALRTGYAAGEGAARDRARSAKDPWWRRDRFENPNPGAETLTADDARTIVAMDRGYVSWPRAEAILHLTDGVAAAIDAVRGGSVADLRRALREDPLAANPRWIPGYVPADDEPSNEAIPLFHVGLGIFEGTNTRANDYELTQLLIEGGADVEILDGTPITSAASFNAGGMARALLDHDVHADGPGRMGIPMAHALFFGFTQLSEDLADRGASLDLRFAAGLGRLEVMGTFFEPDGRLRDGAGALADPYTSSGRPHREKRTRHLVMQQALLFATLHGRLDAAALLLDRGASPSALVPGTDIGATCLHRLSALGSYGSTENFDAVDQRRVPAVEFLLGHGADPNVRDDRSGSTALEWALRSKAQRVAAALRQAGGAASAGRPGRVS
jgi:hypothetical protein